MSHVAAHVTNTTVRELMMTTVMRLAVIHDRPVIVHSSSSSATHAVELYTQLRLSFPQSQTRICYGNSVCLSVCLYVCHTRALSQIQGCIIMLGFTPR